MRLRPAAYFSFIVVVSVVLYIVAIVFLYLQPNNTFVPHEAVGVFQLQPAVVATPPVVQPHCLDMIRRRKLKATKVIETLTPPWVSLVSNTAAAMVTENSSSNNNKSSTTKRQLLYVHVWAAQTRRLGNQLFNYASLFGVAWRNRRVPLWPDGKTQLRTVFNLRVPIDLKNVLINSPESHNVRLREPGWAIYGNRTEQLPDSNMSLAVFLQSWKYFLHVEDQLRLDFTFKQSVIEKARRFLNASTPSHWRGVDFVRVVIHVRRGDYVNKGQQRFGWALPEPDYFNRSMAYFAGCLPRVQFVVLSNDMKWCRRNIVGENVVYSGGRTPTDDMAIASLCDHAIVTIGSYGWWSAWFANGVTVTQKNFPTPNSPLLKRLSRTDYYKPEWTSL